MFRPPPRVDSALIAFERQHVAAVGDVRPLVEAAFAHRRKTFANSVATSGLAPRARVEGVLAELGYAPNVRAEELEPAAFVELARLVG